MSLKWEDCELYHCLGALELHNRIVAMGLDGTTSGGGGGSGHAHHASTTVDALSNDGANSSDQQPQGDTPLHAVFSEGEAPTFMPSPSNGNSFNSKKAAGAAAAINNKLSRLIGGNSGRNHASFGGGDTSEQNTLKTAPPTTPQVLSSSSNVHNDPMDSLRKSVRTTVAAATGNTTLYYKYFLRSVLWRIYLRLLPFPYTGTARDTIVEDWPSVLFRCRAWYGGQRQQFLNCYPAHNFVANDCDDYEPQNNVRTFTLFAEKAALAAADAEGDDFGGGFGQSSSPSLRNTYRNSTVAGTSGFAGPAFSQSYTTTSVLDGAPTSIKEDIIAIDIKRTYVSADSDVPHHTLFMVLAMWRWQNPLVGYQQGMHEIAGNILLMLKRACEGVPKNTPPEVAQCANLAYVEADTYMIFDAFMNELGLAELFAASSAANQQNATGRTARSSSPPLSSRNRGGNDDDDASSSVSSPPQPNELTTLEALCHHIVFDLLKDHSLSLFNHFANTSVLDQLLLFLPRWIRNLFTREMSRPQVFAVWDGILAVYYSDVVSAAIAEQEREAAKKALLGQNQNSGQGKGGGLLSAFRNSIRFKNDTNEGQFTQYISATDGNNKVLGSFSPALTDIAYVGEPITTTTTTTSRGRSTGSTNGYGSDEEEAALGNSHRSLVSNATALPSGRSTKRGIGRRVGGFLRTVAGVAVELLLYLEDDLLELNDDFSQLKRLTRTPLLPPTADAVGILLRATTIARTRPRGLVLKNNGSGGTSVSANAAGGNTTLNVTGRNQHRSTISTINTGQVNRLTREELLGQQKSVALVIANAASRLRTIMAEHAPPNAGENNNNGGDYGSQSPNSPRDKKSLPKTLTISAEEVAQLQGVLLELEHLTDKLV